MTGYSVRKTFIFGIVFFGGIHILYRAATYVKLKTWSLDKILVLRLVDEAPRLMPSTVSSTKDLLLEQCPENPPGLDNAIIKIYI